MRNASLRIRQSRRPCRKRWRCSGAKWGEAEVLAGGTDLLSLMKDYVHTPKRVVNIKDIKELGGIQKTAAGFRIGATVTIDELAENAEIRKLYPSLADGGGAASPARRSATWARWAATCASARAAGTSAAASACWPRTGGQDAGAERREPVSRHPRQQRPGVLRQRLEPRAGADRAGAKVKLVSAKGSRGSGGGEVLRRAEDGSQRARSRCSRTRS